jgi:hexosaminidase
VPSFILHKPVSAHRHAWGYQCVDSKCVRTQISSSTETSILALRVCRLYCYEDIGTLWPIPTGNVDFAKSAVHFDPLSIAFESETLDGSVYFTAATERFVEMQSRKIPAKYPVESGGKGLLVVVDVESGDMSLDYETKEGYELALVEESNRFRAMITAENFFGARHGIETLSQLIVHDDLNNRLVILASASITDEPKFRHRGISMDTSRTFFPVDVIKRTINGLAMTKLNTFHWHITDAMSYPMEMKKHKDLTKYGAYSSKKIYTVADIRDIVEFSKSRGVRVIPEFDAPAHVGEGWQNKLNLTTCFDHKPYLDYCWQPPCGHLDPTKDEVYDVLEDIYGEMIEAFDPPAFHMGGDEIFFSCWNSSESLRQWMTARDWQLDSEHFMKLWGIFQTRAQERLDRMSSGRLPLILWTSELTEEPHVSEYLDSERYIVQVWTEGGDERIQRLLEGGYKLIISNYDALYLDCGYGSWASDGYIWCSPYHEWQKLYQNDLNAMGGERVNQIYGAEATVWSETIDERNIDARVWPRASALAERLWSSECF